MKDLKLEQTKPVGRIWTDKFGFEEIFHIPLEIQSSGLGGVKHSIKVLKDEGFVYHRDIRYVRLDRLSEEHF